MLRHQLETASDNRMGMIQIENCKLTIENYVETRR